jgi:protein-L-isoaspartate O-methyltransferase
MLPCLIPSRGPGTGSAEYSDTTRSAGLASPLSYQNLLLPIREGQTISQPFMVALMTELLDAKSRDTVLEIGTGSGYQAAVLAELVAKVYTIEIVEPLGQRAMQLLEQLGYRNVAVGIGDGYQGWPGAAPFDAIIVTAASPEIPKLLLDQLEPGGRMVNPCRPLRGAAAPGRGQAAGRHRPGTPHGAGEGRAPHPISRDEIGVDQGLLTECEFTRSRAAAGSR